MRPSSSRSRYQIQQIINLITNAIDAKEDIDRHPLLRIRIRNAKGDRALTEFIDNGHERQDDGLTKYPTHSYRPRRTGWALISPFNARSSKLTTGGSGL